MNKPTRRMRRRQDDIDAGLLFAWRVPGGSLGRTVIGVLVATMLFAGAASFLHVRVPLAPIPSRESAQVIVLGEKDTLSRELLAWARFHSPFPDRWDPPGTGQLHREMERLDARLAERTSYRPRLLPWSEPSPEPVLPDLIALESFPLPPTGKRSTLPRLGVVAESVEAVAVAGGALRERWGVRRMPLTARRRAEMVGMETSYTVGVLPDGAVRFCLALDGDGGPVDDALKAWIRTQRIEADPAAEELVLDVVTVRFVAEQSDAPSPNPATDTP